MATLKEQILALLGLAGTLRSLAAALERLGIPYVIGGSMASSVRGIVRATYAVDIVAAIAASKAERFARELGPEWYADPDQMREAIAARRAFNVIHIRVRSWIRPRMGGAVERRRSARKGAG
ncbi:MAG: hypothetical protein ABSC23_09035 [Bryobacteraceae bacterium]|jgi:D-alanine-D-alanine ligase-like ATP-grasp enzyme